MERTTSMEDERLTIDDHIVFLTYYYIKAALYMMEILNGTAMRFLRENDVLTPEVKRKIKADYELTSRDMMALGQAEKAYRMLVKSLEVVEVDMDSRSAHMDYDRAVAMVNDLIATNIVYSELTQHGENDKNRKKIQDYLHKYTWDLEGMTDLYDSLMDSRNKIMDDYRKRHGENK